MPEIVLTFDVADVDPTTLDPMEVAEYLFSLYDEDRRVGNAPYELAAGSLSAEWESLT